MMTLASKLQNRSHIQSFFIALFYNRAGMSEEAIKWLERGYESHDPDMVYGFLPLEFSNLRSDPSYEKLAALMKVPY